VSSGDVLTRVREALLQGSGGTATTGVAVALENDSVRIVGLELGEDRIKRLGRWEVEIVPGKGVDPVRRVVEVVPEE
jgi:phage gp45-like